MKANQELKNGTTQKKSKKENARDIISKSVQKVCGRKNGTIEKIYSEKLGFTIGYSVGSKSKLKIMKSYQILKNEAKQKLKNNKKENAMGVISKSILKAGRIVRAGVLINSKFFNYE